MPQMPPTSGTTAQQAEKAADEDAQHAPAFKERVAARQQLRIARQRPHMRHPALIVIADPVREPVAENAPAAAAAQIGQKAMPLSPISAPSASRITVAGSSSDKNASDSPNARKR